ncbi:hypothetical protein OG458_15855 [Streptomyces sp. NBC_01281]|uniref:hypothetical protein n=1 Tax=unclassified Streptomyces TaxID=2593676 RepID=UPI002E13CA71|nr:hypothetical protein OG458_15855 [Streptomyces sp. NBC_01281]
MNALMDNLVGILVVLAIFALVALPSLIGLARERRVDRQLRAAAGARQDAWRPPRPQAFVTTTVTAHS